MMSLNSNYLTSESRGEYLSAWSYRNAVQLMAEETLIADYEAVVPNSQHNAALLGDEIG